MTAQISIPWYTAQTYEPDTASVPLWSIPSSSTSFTRESRNPLIGHEVYIIHGDMKGWYAYVKDVHGDSVVVTAANRDFRYKLGQLVHWCAEIC